MRGGVACLETTRAHTCGCARIAWKAWAPSTRASPGVASAVPVIGHVASTTAKAAVTYIARHAMKPTPEKTGASAAAPMISLSQPVTSLMPCRSRPPQRNGKNGRGTTSSNSTSCGLHRRLRPVLTCLDAKSSTRAPNLSGLRSPRFLLGGPLSGGVGYAVCTACSAHRQSDIEDLTASVATGARPSRSLRHRRHQHYRWVSRSTWLNTRR
jgi:hypothetical protein